MDKTQLAGSGQLIPPKHVARQLGVTPETLAVWRCTGRYPLPYVKIGRKVMYRLEDLEAFIKRGLRHHTGERNTATSYSGGAK